MPEDLADELRVTNETPESIKARLIADTNAGIDPNDPAYADVVVGAFWDDLNGARVLEDDRIYDRMNEVVANAIPSSASGAFLDAWAQTLGLDRKDATAAAGQVTVTGADGTVVSDGTQVSTVQTDPDAPPLTFVTAQSGVIAGGSLTVDVTAVELGSAGNVPAHTVTLLNTPLGDGFAVTNALAITGGSDVETDEALQRRIVRKLSGAGGGGNQDDYVNWGLNYPGVGFVTVQANTPQTGHVTVSITDVNNDPMPTPSIAGLQQVLDPSSSSTQGAGAAPIGATVYVTTPTTKSVTVEAPGLILVPGYTLDGASGTFAVRGPIEASVARYVNALPAGADVVHNKVLAAIIDVVGVNDVPALTLDGAAGNVTISPTQVASLTTPITLS